MAATSASSRSSSGATSRFENSPSKRFVPSVTRFLTRIGSCLLSGLVRCVGIVIVRQGYVWTSCSSCNSCRFMTCLHLAAAFATATWTRDRTKSLCRYGRQIRLQRLTQRLFVVLAERRLEELALPGKVLQACHHLVDRRLANEQEQPGGARLEGTPEVLHHPVVQADIGQFG